ncbi:serine/threonine-protein kinase D1-like [Argopecten irradians]|uniref:serine/threonine-protein kinase D1-like n=1 Tax=Argopecten irradians TaxID=31199 RepID=UPI003718D8F1
MVASSSDLQYSDVESYSSHRSTSASENYVITGNPHSVILTPRSSASSRSSIAILNASLVASSTEIYYSDVESSHRSTSAPGNVIAGSSHSISMAAIENELMALMDSPRVVHQQTSTSLCVLIGGMEYQYQHSHFNFSVFGNQVRTVDATIEILSSVDFLNEINPENGGLNILGSGVFGSVFTSKHLVTGKRVAIKAYHNEDIKHIVAEARYLQVLNTTGFTPQLLGLLPNPVDPREIYLVMEMVGEGVTLRKRLEKNDLSEKDKLSIALRLVIGLHSIHEKKVLINDIKDDNIIIYGTDLRAKFIDFGHASCGFEKSYKGDTSRSYHLAPEVRNHNPTTPASDVYSLGDTLGYFSVNKLNSLVYRCKRPDPVERPLLPHMAGELMVLLK